MTQVDETELKCIGAMAPRLNIETRMVLRSDPIFVLNTVLHLCSNRDRLLVVVHRTTASRPCQQMTALREQRPARLRLHPDIAGAGHGAAGVVVLPGRATVGELWAAALEQRLELFLTQLVPPARPLRRGRRA